VKLTQLEIKGFKSFADRTVINFNERITGVVGPNGCGKSNVVDAIRWVLGEQKPSMLRLEKMENLIFNGTKSRKASSLAEVSLTFENTNNVLPTEYKTVTITRKLFRDGESEYRLNDVSCRLKDISNLFMDTGISADSYAIIELGMVDEILNDRENSRRRLFEQASGISKYKSRKRETLLKLKGTEGDLDRVKDLLFEIEGNLKTLETQARRTQRFYAFKEQYKELSIELAKFNLQAHKASFKQLKADSEQEENRKIELEKEVAKAEAAIEKEKLSNLDFEKALAEVQRSLNTLLSGVSSKENDRNLLQQKLQFEIERRDNAGRQIDQSRDKLEGLDQSIEQLTQQVATEDEKLSILKEETEKLRVLYEAAKQEQQQIKHTLDENQKVYSDRERSIVELEKKTAVNKATRENLQKQLDQNRQESLFKHDELKALQDQFGGIEGRKTLLDAKLQELLEADQRTQAALTENEATFSAIQQDLIKENRAIDAKQNEYNLTKSMVESMEGFPEAVKFLKKNAKWTKEAPLLSDIVYCNEQYRICIENYLEPYLNYYVVDTLDDAYMAVNLLSDSSKGRANFFILDDFKAYAKKTPAPMEGAIAAVDIIELDPRYQALGNFLLDRVYIIDDAAQHFDIRANRGKDYIKLAKSGKYVSADYTLSGGAVGLFEGKKIGRAKNLEKLEKELSKHNENSKALSLKLEKVQETINQLKASFKKAEIEQLRGELNQTNNQFTALKTRIETAQSFIDSAEAKLLEIASRIKALDDEELNIQTQLANFRAEQGTQKEELEKQDKVFIELSNRSSELSVNFNAQNIAFHQQSNRVASLQQEMKFKVDQRQELRAQNEKNTILINEAGDKLDEFKTQLNALEEELLSGYDNREQIKKTLETAEQQYYDSKGKITELENTHRETLKNRHQCEQLLIQTKDKLNDLKIELSSIRERLSIEFNADINEVLNQEPNEALNPAELEEKVKEIKGKIEKFGEINPMAVEAFDEMKKRYDFIVAQKADLEQSKQTLVDTITEIESTAKQKFMESFNHVRDNFIRVFKTLFNEDDTADLILLTPDDPLESKIDIIAKPKGKRPQIIDQLSGGEKTLTATALLFSLYLLKPAPFCIFDEVDAPLDDANISKFNNIIREFSNSSQFIIVTHNKSTMSHVDVMYGVVMQELGVSQVAPVDFRNWNDE
jgi:chromosome segregation protein